ncbi:MAG: LPS export ABC transporter periplasmic protein LptC [Spirochaetales bacterium]|nr:LPS export ABC transporter periplasmic protein LptC [Spirochaetales bacterium]
MIRIVSGLLLLFLAAGCSLDYGTALTDDDISNTTPNTVIEEMTFVSVRQGRPVMEITAERALSYNSRKETHLEGVHFREFDARGDVAAEGSGGRGVYFLDTENVEMEDGLNLYSQTEESGISAEHLYWTKKTKELTGRKDSLVRIERDDGTFIQGYEFRGNLQTKTFTFETNSSGMLVTEEGTPGENGTPGNTADEP